MFIATHTRSFVNTWLLLKEHGFQGRSRHFTLLPFLPSECRSSLQWGGCAGQHRYDHLGRRQHTCGLSEQPQHGPSSGWECAFRTSLELQLPGNYQGYPEQLYSQSLVYTLIDGSQHRQLDLKRNLGLHDHFKQNFHLKPKFKRHNKANGPINRPISWLLCLCRQPY
jgi:hypothetical protein